MTKNTGLKLGLLTLCAIIILGFTVKWENLPDFTAEQIAVWARSLGVLGPISVIGFMWLAVVVSPIPSAPIAIASGALYGHFGGTVYVAIGAEIGAVTAFLIARYIARDSVEAWTKGRLQSGLLGSQNALTVTVFVSRVIPFISFDAFSYAAGISNIHLWRFALATLAGIIPTSFIFTHIGSIASATDFSTSIWVVLGMGAVTALSIFAGSVLMKNKLKKL